MNDRDTAEMLETFLAERDAPCPRCGYNLRALRGQRCPECGEALVLRVGLEHPKIGTLIAGVIALAAGTGLNGLLLGYGMIRVAIDGYRGFMDEFFVYNGSAFVVEAALLVTWLANWRRIHRMETGRRAMLAVGCWGP